MKKGFTLAEVLITLAIIGVVAAMTIPTLIQNYQEKALVVRLKKIYSVLEQSYQTAMIEDGDPSEWNAATSADFAGHFIPHLKQNVQNCSATTKCFADTYKCLNGGVKTPNVSFSNISLADGTAAAFNLSSSNCSTAYGTSPKTRDGCAEIHVDVNGFAPPNLYGKDFFAFYVTKQGIVPTGLSDDTYRTFASCTQKTGTGFSCTAWAIYNENMDYLHCKDLSWGGKTKCE